MDEELKAYRIEPGQSRSFRYIGNLVPNEISVGNLSPTEGAEFRLTSDPPCWWYYYALPANRKTSILVNFPSSQLTCHDIGPGPIILSGDWIEPI